MLNENEKNFIELLKQVMRCVKGELELNCFDDGDGEWYAMDYIEDLCSSFPIDINGFNKPIITNEEAENKGIDIVKCCDKLGILYVG